MNHLPVLPIVLPLLAGALLLLTERAGLTAQRALAAVAMLLQLGVAWLLVQSAATGEVSIYLLGDWPAQIGISLALDRLSALMVATTAVLCSAALLYAGSGWDSRALHFHALFQFQLAGLNGAFLTSDLFNLFVFFEVLLIASYGLLVHGLGKARLRASIHYVVFNLAGSSLFLVAVALLYALTGTLNMADLAVRVPLLPASDALLIRTAALLLLVVFCVKAALLPLYFWLPETYGSATAPVAALFAIMTKVGVYTIARVYTLVFGDGGGAAANVAWPWLPWLALGTLALGAIGALASTRLRGLVAYLVVASAGTLLLALGLGRAETVSAGLFYLVHSTLMAAALFLIVDRVAGLRGDTGDRLLPAPMTTSPALLGAAFFFCAAAAGGLPPLAGFLGKALLLDATIGSALAVPTWVVVLLAGLGTIVALSRAGSVLFWGSPAAAAEMAAEMGAGMAAGMAAGLADPATAAPTAARAAAHVPDAARSTPGQFAAIGLLVAAMAATAAWAGPLHAYTTAASRQLFEPAAYVEAVLGARPVPAAIDIRREMRERGGAKGDKR